MENKDKHTLVLGASPNPDRPSWEAMTGLLHRKIPFIAVGKREYEYGGIKILKSIPDKYPVIHTIAVYMSAANQEEFYDKILEINPKRLIFNPGTTNPMLADLASFNGIEVIDHCLLTMLRNGDF